MNKIKNFIETLEQKVVENKGKKGVSVLKKSLEACKEEYYRYQRFNPSKTKYIISPKWLHRKGIQEDPQMIEERQRYQKALSCRAILKRGTYGQIIPPFAHDLHKKISRYDKAFDIWTSGLQAAEKCIKAIENQGFDEHGGWETRAEFDKHGRGTAINTDIYGIDEENQLFVVQVRRYDKHTKNGWGSVQKNYFLIGYNENGNPFAHSIPSRVVHAAIKKDSSILSPVKAAQAWIWDIPIERLSDINRQGDVALIPAKKIPTDDYRRSSGIMQIIDSHYLYSKEVRINGAIYALNPTLRHMKKQHPTIKGKGWCKVLVGRRADFHDFARSTAD